MTWIKAIIANTMNELIVNLYNKESSLGLIDSQTPKAPNAAMSANIQVIIKYITIIPYVRIREMMTTIINNKTVITEPLNSTSSSFGLI